MSKAALRMPKASSRHEPSGWLLPQRGTRCPRLWGLFGSGRGCWGRVRTENRSGKPSSGVSWLCSSSCSSPWLQSFGAGSKTLFCLSAMKSVLLKTSARMSLLAPVHVTQWEQVERRTFSLRRARQRPRFTCSPQGILHLPGFCPFQAARLSYLLILFQQVHLTWSGQDAALLWLRHQPTDSPLITPRYTRLTMQGPKHRNKGKNRVLM